MRSVIHGPERAAVIVGETVFLRHPKAEDFAAWSTLRAASRLFLQPWEPVWGKDELTWLSYRMRLRQYAQAMRADETFPFLVFRREDGVLVGGCTLSNVRRGVTQSCSLGYWVGEAHARHGYMTDAVRGIVTHVFSRMGLHRLEAACLPANEPSRRLLTKVGFREEGYARGYLKINGIWQDHVLFAILEDDPRL